MKKSFLLLSSLLAVAGLAYANAPMQLTAAPEQAAKVNHFKAPAKAPALRAEDSEEMYMTVGYANDPYTAFTLGDKVTTSDYIYLAFELKAADQKPYIGSKISGMVISTGSNAQKKNPVQDIYMFVTDDITKPFTTSSMTAAKLGTEEYTRYSVNYDTPFEIKGDKSIYIGYAFKCPGTGAYYIPTDGMKVAQTTNTALIAVEKGYDVVPDFYNYGDQTGSINMWAKVSGDNLPTNDGQMLAINVNPYNAFNDGKFDYQIYVKNMAANAIKNVTVKTEISNGSVTEATYDLTAPIYNQEGAVVNITNVNNKAEGVYALTSTMTKVNGVELAAPQVLGSSLTTYSEGFQRRTVIEEATGIGCGFCPRGITSMDFLRKTYPDWILIAVHCNWFGTDPMTVSQYSGLLSDLYSSNPQAFANRSVEVTMGGSNPLYYQDIYSYYNSFPAYGDINFDAELSESKKTITINATAKFSTPSDVPHYISYVVVEDHVGPYQQHNYYGNPGYGVGSFEGWENKGEYVEMYYDDVARAIKSYPGIRNSLPDEIEANKEYDYSTSVSISKVSGDDFRVIGLITNSVTGEIINARQISMSKVGVENIAADDQNIDIQVVAGEIVVNGAQNVAVYTLDGRRVNANGLSNGVYIVTADGKSTKVLVK